VRCSVVLYTIYFVYKCVSNNLSVCTVAATRDPGVLARYRAGFNECAHEVDRYLAAIDGLKPELRLRMMSHLAQAVDVSVNDVSSSLHYQQQQQQQQENPCMASPPYLLPANMTSFYDSQSRCSFSATSPPIVYNKTECDSPAEVSTTSLGRFRQLSEFSDSSNDCENLPPKQQPLSSAAGTIFRKSSSSSAMRRSSSFGQRNSKEQLFSPLSENRQILPLGLLSGNSNNTLCSVSNSYDSRPNNNSGGVNSAFKPLNSAGIKNEPMWRPW
jgi:hypothetical protein